MTSSTGNKRICLRIPETPGLLEKIQAFIAAGDSPLKGAEVIEDITYYETTQPNCVACGEIIPHEDCVWSADGDPYHTKCLEGSTRTEAVLLPKIFVDAIREYHMKKEFETEAECIVFLARMGMDSDVPYLKALKEQVGKMRLDLAEIKAKVK